MHDEQAEPAPRVAVVTLGCGRNEVDTDQLQGLFLRDGYALAAEADDADVVLVNTCTFIEPAKQESIDTVLAACDLKDRGVGHVLIVGCMAQRYPHELAEAIPEADAVVGFAGYPRLPAIVDDLRSGALDARVVGVEHADTGSRARGGALPLVAVSDGHRPRSQRPAHTVASRRPAPTAQDDLDRIPASGPRFPVRHRDAQAPPWAYLKIASGCDRVCTFCAIPSFRGRFRSRPVDELLAEAAWLSGQGVRELVLVSENTTSWGKDLGGRELQSKLLTELAAVDGIERLRLMYLQPAEIIRPLLETMAAEPAVASYFDLSLQHVSPAVVQRMARSGGAERFLALIDEIRRLDPRAVFRSNFILGFPGETDADVDLLESFLLEARLDWVGLFTFSREDGTPSADLPDQVPAELAEERRTRIADVQERVADGAARGFVGRRLDVLVDECGPEGAVGRSYREAPDTDGEVRLVDDAGRPVEAPPGRLVPAIVRAADGVDLVAEVLR